MNKKLMSLFVVCGAQALPSTTDSYANSDFNTDNFTAGRQVLTQTTQTEEEIAEDLIVVAEGSNDVDDIKAAREAVNLLPESAKKDELQGRLNDIFPAISLDCNTATANVDVYIKSENMLSISLDTNSVTFEDYSGVEDVDMLNAVGITISSSLPYRLNAYMPTEISNADGSNIMDIDVLNIKESTEVAYQQFANTTDKITLKDGCIANNDVSHSIDLKLSGSDAHTADIYKTVVKFEAEQM